MKKNKRLTIIIIIFCFLTFINTIDVYSDDSCEEGKTYYNYYLFNQGLNTGDVNPGVSSVKTGLSTKYAQPYNFFWDKNVYYKIQSEPIVYYVNDTTTAASGEWSASEWWNYQGQIDTFPSTWSGYTWHGTKKYIEEDYTRSSYRYIVAGSQADSFADARNTSNFYDSPFAYNTSDESDTSAYDKVAEKTSVSPDNTWISYLREKDNGNGTTGIYINEEFKGNPTAKYVFQITRDYGTAASWKTRLGFEAGASFDVNNVPKPGRLDESNKMESGVSKWYAPAVALLIYTCRNICNPQTTCCYNENGNYQENYTSYNEENHFKWVNNVISNPGRGASNSSDVRSLGDDYGTLTRAGYYLHTCGCDPTQECCFKKTGTNSYTLDRSLSGENPNYYKYLLNYGTDNEIFADPSKTSGGQYITCGCDPNKECCYTSSGQYYADWSRLPSPAYTLIDPANPSAGTVKCSNNASASKTVCSNPSVPAKYDEVSGNTNNTATLIQGFYTHAGFSTLDSGVKYPTINPGYDVTCKDSYEILYPGNQEGNKSEEERWFFIKDASGGNNIAKITIKRECITTPLSDSSKRLRALSRLTDSDYILDNDALSDITFKYDDINDITNRSGTAKITKFNLSDLKKTISKNTKYYWYTNGNNIPSDTNASGNGNNISSSNASRSYYMRRVDTITYNIEIPDIYVRGARGDTTLQVLSSLKAKLPTGALPIKLSTPARTNYYKYKIKPSFSSGDMNRGTGNRNYSSSSIRFDNNEALNEYTCKYDVYKTPGDIANVFYRTISLSDINPHNRALGMNWEYQNLQRLTGSESKESKMRKVYGQKAYILAGKTAPTGSSDNYFYKNDNDYSRLTNANYNSAFTFTLSPTTMQRIRAYNRRRTSEGGYNDWSLTGIDYVNTQTKAQINGNNRYKQQNNVYGWHWYSEFLSCIYYGGVYCESPDDRTVITGSGGYRSCEQIYGSTSGICNAKYEENFALRDIFSDYEPENSDKYDLNEGRRKLIFNQNTVDKTAYNRAGGT